MSFWIDVTHAFAMTSRSLAPLSGFLCHEGHEGDYRQVSMYFSPLSLVLIILIVTITKVRSGNHFGARKGECLLGPNPWRGTLEFFFCLFLPFLSLFSSVVNLASRKVLHRNKFEELNPSGGFLSSNIL